MSDKGGEHIREEELDNTEKGIVGELNTWLSTNPNAQWNTTRRFQDMEECLQKELREIAMPLKVCLPSAWD
jgi:hypothetical protein